MSDDLKKRLRQHRYNTWNDDLGPEPDKALAADCIEQLKRERDNWQSAADAAYSDYAEIQYKFTRAIEALQEIIARWDTPTWKDVEATGSVINRARTMLAELEKQ